MNIKISDFFSKDGIEVEFFDLINFVSKALWSVLILMVNINHYTVFPPTTVHTDYMSRNKIGKEATTSVAAQWSRKKFTLFNDFKRL